MPLRRAASYLRRNTPEWCVYRPFPDHLGWRHWPRHSATSNYTNQKVMEGLEAEMPLESRLRTSYGAALDLPPPYQLVTLREVGDAFAHATAHAAELGAGGLVFVGRFDLAEFAVIF